MLRPAKIPCASWAARAGRRTRRVTTLACVVACCSPVAASASTFSGTLAVTSVGQPASAYGSVTVTAQVSISQQCDTSYCGYFPLVTTVAEAQPCEPTITGSSWVGDYLTSDEAVQPQTLSPTWYEWPSTNAGQRRACLYVDSGGIDVLVAQTTYTVPAPPRTQAPPGSNPGTTVTPGDDVPRDPIPRSVGVRHPWPFRVSKALVPAGVDPARFLLLVKAAGHRWGLAYAGTTWHSPQTQDGRNTVGFSREVPRGALGITDVLSLVRYARGRLVCHLVVHRGRFARLCARRRGRLLGSQIVEQDTRFRTNVPWNAGPGLPDADHYDLQTTILHELGHYAGNRHARRCRNTPMWTALSKGEWWHSPSDWHENGCGAASARARARRASAPLRMLVRVHVRRVIVG